MKISYTLCALLCVALFFVAANADPSKTILENLKADTSKFSKLVEALTNSNDTALIERLNSTTSTTTIFAPENEAIDKTTGVPVSFFLYHLANGNTTLKTNGELVQTLLTLVTLSNNSQVVQVSINGAETKLNGDAQVTGTIDASNGVIYSINKNLTAPGALSSLLDNASLSTLKAAVTAAGLSITQNSVTLFAPTNAAFEAVPDYIRTFLFTDAGKPQLAKILEGHLVVDNVFYLYGQTGQHSLNSVEGQKLDVDVGANNSTVNGALIAQGDVLAASGVAHIIEKVLVPADVQFSILDVLTGLKMSDYVTNLNKSAPALYTKLAATTGAYTVFVAQPFADNAALIEYAVVDGVFNAADLKDGQLLPTEYVRAASLGGLGQKLKVSVDKDKKVFINGVEVVEVDKTAANGVVHVLKNQLASVPASIDSQLIGDFSTLGKAIQLAGLKGNFSAADGSFTVFAPTNDAFDKVSPALAGFFFLNTTASNAQLAKVLSYHVANKVIYSADIKTPATVDMLDGQNIEITGNGTLTINGNAKITAVDTLASNGVVHTIDNVLVPNGLQVNFDNLIQGLKANDFFKYLNKTGLLATLNKATNFTVFVPTDAAFKKVKDQKSITGAPTKDLAKLLSKHVVLNLALTTLRNATYTSLEGTKIKVYSETHKTRDTTAWYVNIVGSKDPAGRIADGSQTIGTQTASVYPIDQVLGQADKEEDDDGLTSTEVGLIVAGVIVAVLLAGAAIGGGVWYYKRRHGYEQIDADSTF